MTAIPATLFDDHDRVRVEMRVERSDGHWLLTLDGTVADALHSGFRFDAVDYPQTTIEDMIEGVKLGPIDYDVEIKMRMRPDETAQDPLAMMGTVRWVPNEQ